MLTELAALRGHQREVSAVFLYRKGELIKVIKSTGDCMSVRTSTTDLIAEAVEIRADAVLFAHNHPGGSTEPSTEDIITATERRDVFEGHDIKVMDNIIVTPEIDYINRY